MIRVSGLLAFLCGSGAFVPPVIHSPLSSSFLSLQPDGFIQGNTFDSNPMYFQDNNNNKYGVSSRPDLDSEGEEGLGPMVRAGLSPDGFPIQGFPMTRMDPSAPPRRASSAFDSTSPTPPTSTIQGAGSRATFSSPDSYGGMTDEMSVHLGTAGRPLEAMVSNWRSPNDSPTKMRLYSEDGGRYPWMTKFKTPQRVSGSSISAGVTEVRNMGPMEFPIEAAVIATSSSNPEGNPATGPSPWLGSNLSAPKEIHGGDLTTFGFDPDVQHVYVEISSEGMPIYAKVELYQGPMNAKAIADIYTDSGMIRPWSAVIPMPGPGASLCILNEGPVAYPLTVRMDPPPRSVSFG